MRLGKWSLSLVVAILLVGGGVTAIHLIMRGLDGDLGGFFGSLRMLEREMEVTEQLEEAFRRTVDRSTEKKSVLEDLLEQRCSFSEAVLRYRGLCQSGDLLSFRSVYLQRDASEQEIVAHHLVILAGRRIKEQPSVGAEVLHRLKQEEAQFHSTRPLATGA